MLQMEDSNMITGLSMSVYGSVHGNGKIEGTYWNEVLFGKY